MGNTCTNCHACKGDGGEAGEIQTSVSIYYSKINYNIDLKAKTSRHCKYII
jgi:hypothetical protein